MSHRSKLVAVCVTAWSICVASADPAPVLNPEKDIDGKALPFGRAVHQASDTPLGTGPYKAIMMEDPSFTNHTLYYPANLAAAVEAGGKLPVIVWGNGACLNAGNRFRIFLTEIASHGFLVIAGGPIANIKYEVGPQENPAVGGARGAAAAAPPVVFPPGYDDTAYNNVTGRNTAEQMIEGIDWALKENERPESKFYHKLSTSKIGVAGQSCGGSLAITVSADPRVAASAFFSAAGGGGGGRGNRGGAVTTNAPGALATPPNPRLDALHGPVMLVTGDAANDIAFQGAASTAEYLSKVPVFYAWQEKLTHIGTYGMPNGGQLGRLAWQWFAWQLRSDASAATAFKGADCPICLEAGWHVQKKEAIIFR